MPVKIFASDKVNLLEDASHPAGRYANHFEVGHNAFEFLLDFGQLYAKSTRTSSHTRIVTTPVYAKTFLGILQRAVDQYELSFGTIPDGNQ